MPLITLRIEDATKILLSEIAEREGCTVSELIRRIIREYLSEMKIRENLYEYFSKKKKKTKGVADIHEEEEKGLP